MKLSREIKTGIIVVGGILLFVLGFSYLKASPLFETSKVLYATYPNVAGLQTGTSVTINGFSVGKVTDISFKDNSGNLLVTFTVGESLDFSKNSTAEIYDTGIIGGKGIQIHPVMDGGPLAQSGDTLRAATKPGLTELVQQKLTPLQMKIEGAVTNADSLLGNVNQVLDTDTKKSLKEAIQGLSTLVASFQGSANELNAILTENRGSLESSLKNINTMSSNLAQLTDSISHVGLASTLQSLESTMADLNKLVARIEQGDGTLGRLLEDEDLYNNLNSASRELDLLLQDFRLNPKRYVNVSVFGKKQKEYELPENDPANPQPSLESQE